MIKKIIPVVMLFSSLSIVAQDNKIGVGIGTPVPSAAAMLDISSTDRGVLIPRLALEDDNTFLQVGEGSKAHNIGMLVYHTGANNLMEGFYHWSGTKWDRITSEKELSTVINEVKTEISKEIEKITEIPGTNGENGENGSNGEAPDMSYMVVYSPTTDKLSYLVKSTNEGVVSYEKNEITFGELVKGEETKTFFREIKKEQDKSDGTGTETVLVGYEYFGEEVISKWLETASNKLEDIPEGTGFTIDVLSSVKENIETIIKESETIIQEVIKETEGTVRVVTVGGKPVLQYKPENSDEYVNVDLTGVETVTSIDKMEWDTEAEEYKKGNNTIVNNVFPAGAEGKIIYVFEGEPDADGNRTKQYIDISADIVNTVTNNTTVQETINNTVNEYFDTKGGNVFYGPLEETSDTHVLYVMDGEDKNVIDITESVKEVFETIITEKETNTEIVNIIKEATGVDVNVGTAAVETGDKIDNKKVFRQVANIRVNDEDYGYDSDFDGTLTVANLGTLLNVSIFNNEGNVVVNTVTDVRKTATTLKFSFGQGSNYTPIKNGTYSVVFEYIETANNG